MNPKEQIQIVFDLLKLHLRERKISYRQLAQRTGMSEANVKRIFSVQSSDLERLMQFCEASDLSFFDLMLEAKNAGPNVYRLSEDVEEFFFDNFECFIFYRKLSGAPDLNKLIAQSRLADRKVTGFLPDLERLGLIEKVATGYRLRHTGYLALADNSKLKKKLEAEWVPWFYERILSERPAKGHDLKLFSTGLSESHRLQMLQEISDLLAKYRKIGLSDQRPGNTAFAPVAVCVGVGPYRVGRFEPEAQSLGVADLPAPVEHVPYLAPTL